jgi:Xaa-Pro aminopeptidase
MKSDIDTLMQSANIDALLVTGPGQHNPAMVYLTGVAHMTSAELIKVRGKPALLFYNSMERDEANSTGLETRNLDDYRIIELINKFEGDLIPATAERYRMMFGEAGILNGRVAIYGQKDAGEAFAVFTALQELMPEVTLVGELGDSILLEAMATKDEDEVNRIRRMGKITTTVVGQVAEFLKSFQVSDEVLVKPDGKPLTIREVKSRINLWLAEYGVENVHGTIFAIGRDAGVPHSSGNSADVLRLGQTIVFDIFPSEAGGGYHYDFTRTWCLGYAPDETQELYENVLDVYRQIMSELRAGELCKVYQDLTCELFEAQGHPTIQNDPQTQVGYVHSLGHGLGLHVHERPMFRSVPSNMGRLDPGVVVTIEPGLYYPERGLGVRLEDTVWIRPDGQPEILADYPLDLVLPMND